MAEVSTLNALEQQIKDSALNSHVITNNPLMGCVGAINAMREGRLSPEQEAAAIELIYKILAEREEFRAYYEREVVPVLVNTDTRSAAYSEAIHKILEAAPVEKNN